MDPQKGIYDPDSKFWYPDTPSPPIYDCILGAEQLYAFMAICSNVTAIFDVFAGNQGLLPISNINCPTVNNGFAYCGIYFKIIGLFVNLFDLIAT